MDRVEVKSRHGRTSLSMQVTSLASDETLFIATLSDPPFYGEVATMSSFGRAMTRAIPTTRDEHTELVGRSST